MSEIKIGYVIKKQLKEKNIQSLKTVTRDTGIPYSTLHTWLQNRKPRDVLKAQKLAEYFGISLHYLLFEEEDINGRLAKKEFTQTLQLQGGTLVGTFEITVKKLE